MILANIKSVTNHKGKIFVCKECDKIFKKNSKLERHVKETHENERLEKCEHCGK